MTNPKEYDIPLLNYEERNNLFAFRKACIQELTIAFKGHAAFLTKMSTDKPKGRSSEEIIAMGAPLEIANQLLLESWRQALQLDAASQGNMRAIVEIS